jgi:hypothetical protein
LQLLGLCLLDLEQSRELDRPFLSDLLLGGSPAILELALELFHGFAVVLQDGVLFLRFLLQSVDLIGVPIDKTLQKFVVSGCLIELSLYLPKGLAYYDEVAAEGLAVDRDREQVLGLYFHNRIE